uniref:LAGLIDADG endonuclease n=1 Tax=Chrysoporthe austroafricana TaxID=354353 RepID=A0A191MWR4_9PEZI|nr:LAGLIDADG endonuclease [Chrysoporthe austroafricana]AMX22116.1 LAGLIDADG endonuclease [Chrysoporthe austroafricana]
MDYRGSKSIINYKPASQNFIVVKEQRVDGSWCNNNLLRLRCILMGFERNYQVKILSNQINNLRRYTSITTHKPTNTSSIFNPWFITGFSDAECSFSILIQANSKYSTGWRIKPVFAIGLHKKDLELLKGIQSYLGVGKIHIHGKDSIQFRVDSPKELEVIINHFENYPLVTAKWADYTLFKKALDIILLKEHLSQKGLLKLVGIKASLNLGLNGSLKEAFPNWEELQIDRPSYVFKGILDPNWIAGFASGDSSFNVKISNSPTSLLDKRVQLRFGIGLNIREKALIQYLVAYFDLSANLKNIYFNVNSARFEVVKFSDITDKIIPFFDNYLIQGKKNLDYIYFKKVADIIKSKNHLTSEGFQEILDIKARMNK